jgi:hypothetical protein
LEPENYYSLLGSDSVEWDFDRFVESGTKSEKYFTKVNLGLIENPATIVDSHGKILIWYLPGLLLPCRVVRCVSCPKSVVFADFA